MSREIIACAIFLLMAISRRGFFSRFLAPGERRERARKQRIEAIEAYARTSLLPYDFSLDAEQTAQLFEQIRISVSSLSDEDLHSAQVLSIANAIAASMIEPWREARWKADEIRHAAGPLIEEFLAAEATPENLRQLRNRFNIPYPAVVEEEVRKQAQSWLNGLSDSLLAQQTPESIRELVFSELRSWC